mmetsp:Transcript_3422/g.9291  ORF Transcript_3422/g.9291 Transcript_3422/m.9291 type:complete len:220 (-) Transcript_3422:1102-1761(-)
MGSLMGQSGNNARREELRPNFVTLLKRVPLAVTTRAGKGDASESSSSSAATARFGSSRAGWFWARSPLTTRKTSARCVHATLLLTARRAATCNGSSEARPSSGAAASPMAPHHGRCCAQRRATKSSQGIVGCWPPAPVVCCCSGEPCPCLKRISFGVGMAMSPSSTALCAKGNQGVALPACLHSEVAAACRSAAGLGPSDPGVSTGPGTSSGSGMALQE